MPQNDANVNQQNAGSPASRPYFTALQLRTEFGFNVIPLHPRSKRPLVEWKTFQNAMVDEDQMDAWDEQWPDANWAVVCGAISGCVVLDADDAEAVQWLEQYMPAVSPLRVRTSRGAHFYYRYNPSLAQLAAGLEFKSRGINIDVQGDKHYVVAPGSIHESGAVYTMELAAPWDAAPYLCDPFQKRPAGRAELYPGDLSDVDLSNTRETHTVVGEGGRHNLILSRVGSLIRQGLSPSQVLREARQINAELCIPPLADGEIRSIVDSTFASDSRNKILNPQAPSAAPSVRPSDPKTFVADTSDPLADNPWTDEILHPGGTLEKICDYIEASAIRTERAFALAGAITLMGALLGQRVQTETELLTNVYCMAVGGSASGKDAPKRAVVRLMTKCAPGLFAGSDVSSEVAIVNHLASAHGHRACLVLDEVGMLLQAAKRPNSAKANVVKVLTELYSGYSSPYTKLYSSADNNVSVSWHALSLLGLSVADELYGAMRDGETVNGWLARNLIFEVQGAPRQKKYSVKPSIPEDLARELEALWAIDAGDGQVETNRKGAVVTEPSPAHPETVYMDAEAKAYHQEHDAAADALASASDEQGQAAGATLWARAGEHAWKLSLIHAASRAGANALLADAIRLPDVRWAWALVETHHRRLAARLETAIFKTEYEETLQRIRAAIQRYVRNEKSRSRKAGHAPKPGAPLSYIVKCLRGVPPRVLDDALKTLGAAKEVFLWTGWRASDKSKRQMDLYCLGHEKESEDE